MEEPRQSNEIERRSKVRYPITLRVRYRSKLKGAHSVDGVGQTVNFSSRGFLVVARDQGVVSVGSHFEAAVEWPVLLNGATPLELVVLGRVVRSETFRLAVSFERYEFRTVKRGPGSVSADQTRRKLA
jgi:hypothetical protein